MFAGVAEGNPSLGVVLNEVGYCQTKYGEESLSDEDQEELLQQTKFIYFLLNKGNISEEAETILSCMKEPVVVEDREQLACLNGQEKTMRQTSRVVTVVGNHNTILMKEEEVVSQEDWFSDKEEDCKDCTKFSTEMPCEITELWNELSLMEDRLARQKINILKVQLNLNEDEIDMSQGEGESVLELKKTENFSGKA